MLTGDEPVSNGAILLKDGWYVVKNTKDGVDVSYTNPIIDAGWPQGPINIILCDDAEMSVAVSGNDGIELNYGFPLTIYGQSAGTGRLTVSSDSKDAIEARGGVTINGGIVSATATNNYKIAIGANGQAITINGGQVTATGTYGIETDGTITFGLRKATDFISFSNVSHHNVIDINNHVKIVDGQALTDGTNIYNNQTPAATLEALENVTLRPAIYTVTFDSNGGSAVDAQTVFHGEKASEPADPTREGYTFGGWKNGDADYDFSAAVTTNLYLTAEWTPITYTVQFDKNNNDATGTMDAVVATYDQWTSIPNCTFTAPTGYVMKEYGWNTAADGSGTKYEAEGDRFWNLATEQDAVVTLYAQWGKDLALCTAEVPDQTLDGSYIYYKFENANWGNAATGTEVKDGDKVLVVGTDYTFGQVYFYGTTKYCTDETNKIGDHFTVEIKGIGDYAGITTADFYIVSPEAEGTWGTLAWSINSDGDFSITGTGAMKETTQGNYPWYSKANGIRTITIGAGITSVAANAFGGTQDVNDYGNVMSITLPSTLTTIGENAFAYCTGATFNADNLIAQGVTIGDNAFNQVGCIVGTLTNNGDNSNMLSLMANAATANVTIKGRTLYKDGNWNTICLPFNVSQYNDLLDGATVKELDLFGYYSEEGVYYSYAASNLRRTGFDAENGTLYLYFKDATADSDDNLLKAGTPYLIKWPSGTDITDDLTFEGVKVILPPHTLTSEDTKVEFRGTFSPVELTGGDASNLYLGVGKNDQNKNVSTLYWPSSDKTINAFRGYFHINSTAQARAFMLNLDDEETTGIISTTNFTNYTNSAGAGWYDLSGRKLPGKPTAKGVYIHQGKKQVIK